MCPRESLFSFAKASVPSGSSYYLWLMNYELAVKKGAIVGWRFTLEGFLTALSLQGFVSIESVDKYRLKMLEY